MSNTLRYKSAILPNLDGSDRARIRKLLVKAVNGGNRFSMDALLAAMNLIVVAGHDTTLNSMPNGVPETARHRPEVRCP